MLARYILNMFGGEKMNIPLHWYYAPNVVNAFFITIFGGLYKIAAFKLTDGENHRYKGDYENQLILKMYFFQFVNSYISNFVYAFYNQDF